MAVISIDFVSYGLGQIRVEGWPLCFPVCYYILTKTSSHGGGLIFKRWGRSTFLMINCITKHISVEGSRLVFHLQSRALAQHPEHVFPQWMYEPLENSYTSTRARHAAPFSSPLDTRLTILKGIEMKCANLFYCSTIFWKFRPFLLREILMKIGFKVISACS